MYRSHDLPKTEFVQNLKVFLFDCQNVKNHFIIGDFNIDLLDLNIISQEHLNNLLERGYSPYFHEITRPSDNERGGSCIDNVFIKTNSLNIEAMRLSVVFPDHYPLFIAIKEKANVEGSNDISNINYKKLKDIASEIKWNNFQLYDPNMAIELLINEIKCCIFNSRHKKINTKNKFKNFPRKLWITKAIMISCSTKEQLYRIWKLDPSNENLKSEYKKYAKILDKVIVAAKIKYDSNLIEKN